MDKNQIIHIASEVVVISGLAIYFKLQNNSLSNQVDELKKRIITQEQLIEEFKNSLDEHSLLISKQDKLLTSLMLNQSHFQTQQIQPQLKKSRVSSVPKQKAGIVWDSETDSSYFPTTKKIYEQKVESPVDRKRVTKKVDLPIEKNRVRQVEKIVEKPVQHLPPPSSESEEDLDEELENELLELQEKNQSESEIIEIDTSLKKKA